MRILFLHSQIPYPMNTGARIRTFQIITGLAREHEITLACFGDPQNIPAEVRAITAAIVVLPGLGVGVADKLKTLLKTLCNRLPFSVNKYKQRQAAKMLAALWQQRPFDLIHVDQPHMAVLLQPHWQAPILIHEHNIESQIARRFFETATHPLLKAFLYVQYRRMERFEHALWKKHPQVVVVSEQDRALVLQQTPGQNVAVVENGVDLDYFSYQPHPGVSPNLVYTGSMDWLPNEDAVLWFAKEMFPLLRSQWPDCTFTVVGRSPSVRVRRLANEPGIVVTGTVKEVRTFLAAATIMVVPLRIGGGSRLKILEAMSAGLPVVSTPIGCEGLRVADEEHLLLAEEPRHFAEQTGRLIANIQLQQKLVQAGRRLVEEHYGWPALAHRLSQLYLSMTQAPSSRKV